MSVQGASFPNWRGTKLGAWHNPRDNEDMNGESTPPCLHVSSPQADQSALVVVGVSGSWAPQLLQMQSGPCSTTDGHEAGKEKVGDPSHSSL